MDKNLEMDATSSHEKKPFISYAFAVSQLNIHIYTWVSKDKRGTIQYKMYWLMLFSRISLNFEWLVKDALLDIGHIFWEIMC